MALNIVHLLSGSPVPLARQFYRCCLAISLGISCLLLVLSCARPAQVAPLRPLQTPPILATAAELSFFQESWQAYQQRFIQADGRVIDWETQEQRSTSEAQAYAMLRAVLIDDPASFERVWRWGENNLARRQANGQIADHLWAWKWGPNETQQWGILDSNFATDADIDVATALILAARRWQQPDYLALAQGKLANIWQFATVETGFKWAPERYLLPGPAAAFQPNATTLYLNPSYLAPYAFRLFAQVDKSHDWLQLVASSYAVLQAGAQISAVGLPSNWVMLNLKTGQYQPLPAATALKSWYGFDAYRVWWRAALDAIWFDTDEATQFLTQHLHSLQGFWQQQQAIPAELDLAGKALVKYESLAQYAMLYPAFKIVDPEIAQAIRQQKLEPAYQGGFWESDSAYYTQNLAWLGMFSPEWVSSEWLQSAR